MHQGGLTLKHVHQTKIQWDSTIYIYSNHQKKKKKNKQKYTSTKKNIQQLSKKQQSQQQNQPPKHPPSRDLTSGFTIVGWRSSARARFIRNIKRMLYTATLAQGRTLRSLVSSVSVWGGWGRDRFLWGGQFREYHLFVQIFFLQSSSW